MNWLYYFVMFDAAVIALFMIFIYWDADSLVGREQRIGL